MARKSGKNIVSIHVSEDSVYSSEIHIERSSFPLTAGRHASVMKRGADWRTLLRPIEVDDGLVVPKFGPIGDRINEAFADNPDIEGWFLRDKHTLMIQVADLGWTEGREENASRLTRWACETLVEIARECGVKQVVHFTDPQFTLFADYHQTPITSLT